MVVIITKMNVQRPSKAIPASRVEGKYLRNGKAPFKERDMVSSTWKHVAVSLEKRRSSLTNYLKEKSADFPLGVPFNIASYSLLLHMVAHVVGMEAYELVWVGGDCHYYMNQQKGVIEQLTRTPTKHPTLWLNPEVGDIYKFTIDDIKVQDYVHQEKIDYPRSV